MKPERFKRTKSVMASSAIALVVAALVIGVSTFVLGPRSASSQRLGFDLTSGSSSFTISSSVYPAPACSGSTALLDPGTPRCMVFSVHNNLTVPISVQSITSTLDTTDYPAPPAVCAGSYLTLPAYSGSFSVPGSGNATSPGVPIELMDGGTNQNACKTLTYHFTYSASAIYTDATTTTLASAPNASTSGQSVTFTATVTASNASTDSSGPNGTVTFDSCTTNTSPCTGVLTQLGNESVGANGQAVFATTSLPAGTDYIEATYGGSGTNFTGSASGLMTQTVTSGSHSTASVLTSSPNPSSYGTSVTLIDTVSSGSGMPAGTITFYSCTASTCSTKTSLGTRNLASGKATYSAPSLPVGTTYLEAVYGASGNYLGSTSHVMSQVVSALSTTSSLTSSPNPSSYGASVTFTDTVSSGSGTPAGTVAFDRCTTNTCSTKTLLGTRTLASGKATYSTSSLPVGTTYVEALYAASDNYLGSASHGVYQMVIGVPSVCASGGYGTYIFGLPAFPFIYGTSGNDFIYAFGGGYRMNGFAGNDCVDAGDGNNILFDGNGADGVAAGNGSNVVVLGNGNDKVIVGNGSDNVSAGNGTDEVTLGSGSDDSVRLGNGADIVAVGNGSESELIVGNGSDTITVGSGWDNDVSLGNGTDIVTIQGSHDDINGGAGNETVYLRSGTYNSYTGRAHHTDVCHLPAPPSSYHGSPAAYYHDSITNCTVVTP